MKIWDVLNTPDNREVVAEHIFAEMASDEIETFIMNALVMEMCDNEMFAYYVSKIPYMLENFIEMEEDES